MTPAYRHSATARAVLRSLVPVICPADAVPLADAIVDHMELTLGTTPGLVRRILPIGFAAYDLGAVPRFGRRAQSLDAARAERYYARWERGPTPVHVEFAHALNQVMSLACYEQPEMMERIGYRVGPWIAEATKKRLTVFADDVRAQEKQILAPDPLRPIAKQEVA